MIYKLIIKSRVFKALEKIKEPDYSRIKKAMFDLCSNPRPNGCKKLKGRPGYRIRVGDFRIIYEIHDSILEIIVINIGDRKDIYN